MEHHWRSTPGSTSRRAASVVAAVVAIVASSVVFAGGAQAAGGLLSVSLTAIDAAVPAGDSLSYSLNQQCSNPVGCGTVTSLIPAPVAWVAADGAPVVNLTPSQIAAGVTGTAAANGTVTVRWPNSPAGLSLNVQANWPTANYTTVPGPQSVTVTATDTAPIPDSATSTATNAVTAVPNLAQSKSGSANAVPGGNVSYTILTSNVQTNPTTAQGGLQLTNVVVTDVLPAGVSNVSAAGGGVYDAITNTVTWPAEATLGGVGGPDTDGQGNLTDTVTYTLPATGASFTDNASATGHPLGGGASVSATSSATTTVLTGPPVVGTHLLKTGPSEAAAGKTVFYSISAGNSGNVVADVTMTDTISTDLNVSSVWSDPDDPSYVGAVTYDVTYSDSSTATFPGSISPLPIFKPGVQVTIVTVTFPSTNPGQVPNISVEAVVGTSIPAGGTLTNCANESVTALGATPATDQSCTGASVVAQISYGFINKSLTQVTPVAIGQTLDWNLVVEGDPSGDEPTDLQPEIIDLIPTQLTYLDGSFALDAGQPASCPTASQYTITVTPNYINGRTGLVASALSGVTIGSMVSCQYLYQTTINAATPSGTYGGDPSQTTAGPTSPINVAYAGNDAYLLDTRGIFESSGKAVNTADLGGRQHDRGRLLGDRRLPGRPIRRSARRQRSRR
jgi:uncharacterized repeat protein (TIGR01451 family)